MRREDLREILFSMLKIVDAILEEENISYSLSGGSMLGAVRHQGFIPWDDDIDIWIWQKDCDRLCQVLKEKLPEHYDIIEPKDLLPNFYDFVFRVVDKRHLWHETTEEDMFYDNKQNHVCIDIFCIIGCPSFRLSRKWLFIKQKIIYGLAMGHRFRLKSKNYSMMKKFQVGVLSFIGRHICMHKILEWQNQLSNKEYNNQNEIYCTVVNDIPSYMGQYYRTKDCMEVRRMKFENYKFPVSIGYDCILTQKYGDYMVPVQDDAVYIKHIDFEDDILSAKNSE